MSSKTSLKIKIVTHHSTSSEIPKLIEVFDKKLNPLKSEWIQSNDYNVQLENGIYLLKLSLPSGLKEEKVIELKSKTIKFLSWDISAYSPQESQEWAYFNKKVSILQPAKKEKPSRRKVQLLDLKTKLYIYQSITKRWVPFPRKMEMRSAPDALNFTIDIPNRMTLLEISGENIPDYHICLPSSKELKCLIKFSEANNDNLNQLDIAIASENWKAEALLSLLSSGAMKEANSLYNAQLAEELLYQKRRDPAAAAIGGYFLLKIGELERLHDWAKNLANWFPWMPDGSVIYAWQLICQKNKTGDTIREIKERLLQALERGIPIYIEGLRLLQVGLQQLSYQQREDRSISAALTKVEHYLRKVDWTQPNTTFINSSIMNLRGDNLLKGGSGLPTQIPKRKIVSAKGRVSYTEPTENVFKAHARKKQNNKTRLR